MIIKKILRQHRRDFTAIYKCGSCGFEKEGGGYDDSYFHSHVIPGMKCDNCGEKAGSDAVTSAPKYDDSVTI